MEGRPGVSSVAVVVNAVGCSQVERPSVRLVGRATNVTWISRGAAEVIELASEDRGAATATVSGQTGSGSPSIGNGVVDPDLVSAAPGMIPDVATQHINFVAIDCMRGVS